MGRPGHLVSFTLFLSINYQVSDNLSLGDNIYCQPLSVKRGISLYGEAPTFNYKFEWRGT